MSDAHYAEILKIIRGGGRVNAGVLEREIMKLRGELEAERAKQKPRPMETAPKDGTFILIIDDQGVIDKAAWMDYYTNSYSDCKPLYLWCVYGSFNDDQGGYETIDNPKGWLPLPDLKNWLPEVEA